MARRAIHLYIVDNEQYCNGIKQMIADMRVQAHISECSTCKEAERAFATREPDVLILDTNACSGGAMEFIRRIRLHHPNMRMLIFTDQDETVYAERALRAGAHGYLMKPADPKPFQAALHEVMEGNYHVSPAIEEQILRAIAGRGRSADLDPKQVLSNRELEIFAKIGKGLTSRDIASQLSLSVKTVATHRAHIKRKLNVCSARDLLQHARDWLPRASPFQWPMAIADCKD